MSGRKLKCRILLRKKNLTKQAKAQELETAKKTATSENQSDIAESRPDRAETPVQDNRVIIGGDGNRGKGRYLANDMTPADDPWLNFDPANPSSKPKTKQFDNDVELVKVEPNSSHFDNDVEIIDVQPASKPVVTSEHKMQMAQIGNNINRARTSADLDKAQQWLDKMPDCEQKQHLQKQLDEKRKKLEPEPYEIDLSNERKQQNNYDDIDDINNVNNAAWLMEEENFYNANNNFNSFDDGADYFGF